MKNFKHLLKSASRATAALVLGAMVSTPLFAAAPAEINYQGKLTDTSGVPFNGTKNITFSFWDNVTVGAGTQLGGDKTVNNVNVVNGVFNAVIDVSGIPFLTNQNVYLQIRIDGSNFGPTRQKLVAAPYALAVAAGSVGVTELNTTSVDGRYVGKSGDENIDGIKTLNGNWVNTANPWADNEVSDTLELVAASTISAVSLRSGTVPNARLDNSSVTLQGNDFNNENQLVKLDGAGALPPVSAINLTNVTATIVGPSSVGTTQIINSTIALADLNTTSIDTRYISTVTAQPINTAKTLNADWDNSANPWTDDEVADTLNLVAASTISAVSLRSGTVPNARLDNSSVTLQGNDFNNENQLVKLDGAGALPPVSAINLTNVTATIVGPSSVGTTQIINSTIALADLNTSSIDTRYISTDTAQVITATKTITANWVNNFHPWSDAEVDNVLSVLAGSTVAAAAIDAGTLHNDVIASSVQVNAVTTAQILDNTIALGDLNTVSVDNRYVTTATAQGISGVKTFSNGVVIGAAGDTIAQYVTVTDSNRNIGNLVAGASTSFTVAVPGTAVGDVVLVTPRENTWLPSVFLLGFVSSPGNVTVNVKNTDSAPSNVGTVDFQISVIQH